jgi:protein TonB
MNTTNIYKADFLDILFEGRNKDYGAYELRRSEDRRVRKALMGTASIALVIIGGYVLGNTVKPMETAIRTEAHTTTVLKDLAVPPPEDKVIPPPLPANPTPPPPAASSIKVATPTITPDELVRAQDEVVKLDSIGNKTIALTTTEGDDINGRDLGSLLGQAGGTGHVVEAPSGGGNTDIDKPYTFVEMMPSFPGGDAALAKYLRDNVHYPRVAQENEIQGSVFVQFIVDRQGNITDVKTVGATKGGGLEDEAMRVVKKMPKWKAGRQNGEFVNVQFSLPIRFTLAN